MTPQPDLPQESRQPSPRTLHREALFTDLYELTMGQAYAAEGMDQTAVFELYFRELPPDRRYAVAAGLTDVIEFLANFRFRDDDIEFLREAGNFSDEFLDRLPAIRFTGDVNAVAEGSVVFPYEPVVQVVAPILEAQLVETFLLNQVHFQTVVASKAARVVTAAAGRTVVDFGSRRAHGFDAALAVARASYLVGAAGTSNVLAGKRYGVPLFGTMAHSYIQAHDDEADAFEAFQSSFPETTLLVDTYDTLDGVDLVVRLAERLGDSFRVRAIRLDSGDLGELARESRRRLDEAGLGEVKIFASGGLDEHEVDRLLSEGYPIDGFGVGTKMSVSRDAPDLDFAYKLVEYAGKGRTKRSPGKRILPGKKQVYRVRDGETFSQDLVAPAEEPHDGDPLLIPVIRDGEVLPAGRVALDDSREHARAEIAGLPASFRSLEPGTTAPPVRFSSAYDRPAT